MSSELEYASLSTKREARLRAMLAKAGLKLADKGAFDAALLELLRIGMGQDSKGNPIAVEHRTRAGAMAALARAHLDIARMSQARKVEVSGPEGGPMQLSIVDVIRKASRDRVEKRNRKK